MAKITKALRATAYHEAGHAVMAVWVRKSFRYVTIEPTELSLGHVMLTKFPAKFNPEIDDYFQVRNHLERNILISLAGRHAEEKFKGRRPDREGYKADYYAAIDFAMYICGSQEEAEAYIIWLMHKMSNTIETSYNWAAVEALADELIKRKKIGYKTARKIIIDARQKNIDAMLKKRPKPKIKEIKERRA